MGGSTGILDSTLPKHKTVKSGICPKIQLEPGDIVLRKMEGSDIPEVVLLFAEHLSRAADPFYALRGLPFTHYLQYWQTVVSKSVARGLATVAVLADHKSHALENELALKDTGGRRASTVAPLLVCAICTLPAKEFLEIDDEDSKHGDREVEDAVYDKHFEAFFRCVFVTLQF